MNITFNSKTDAYCDRGIRILDNFGIAAISTLRPDGWPQCMLIDYANDGYRVYFRTSRNSQQYRNIKHDNRISLAVGREGDYTPDMFAVFAGAYVHEVTDPEEKALALKLLSKQISSWPPSKKVDKRIILCAVCKYVSVLNGSFIRKREDALTVDLSTKLETSVKW